ncbi:hypothetical protein [Mycolicibacterium iranicum]|uniref:PE-PPE domain-containing protein n=1 Tax=Mycolicibacterium iranicum TaxID=912594 RepID=A0A178LMT9_MYCIR|nr:hypothetical protein [Mycolicibacterium iranicum]OAN31616.1 hypothetical protein A4X20_28895 [Mycolicibacterium iranicum]
MNSSVGKPLLGLMAAACVAVPAAIPQAAAAVPEAVVQSAADQIFDPAPPILRLTPDTADAASYSPTAVESLEAAADIDPALLIKLLTFPYHNIYAIGTSIGAALNSALVAALLPLTAGYYFLTNQIDKIEPYIDTTFTNLRNAVPNIFTTINNEIQYDIDLFRQVFGGSEPEEQPLAAADTADAEALADDPGLWLKLLTFPYHNFYAIGTSVGAALNSVVVTALLPLTAGYYFLTNQIDKIGPYIDTTFTNLRNAVPNIFTTINNEIQYDINLFKQIFTPAPDSEMVQLVDTARSVPESGSPEATLGEDTTAGEQPADTGAVETPAEENTPIDGATEDSTVDKVTDLPADETDGAAADDENDVSAPEPASDPAGNDDTGSTAGDSGHVHATKSGHEADTYGRHAKKDVAQDSTASTSAAN